MKQLLLLAIVSMLPLASFAHAAESNAGFPAQSVWVSKTVAVAGETIEIFTAVYNGGNEMLRGTVVFSVDSAEVGRKDIELSAGKSELVSSAWKTTAGEHSITAALEGSTIATAQKQTTSISITVTEPPPAPLAGAATTASNAISGAVHAVTPVATNVANEAYKFVESVRLNTVAHLEDIAAPPAKESGSVLGVSTTSKALEKAGGGQVAQVAAAAVLFTLQSKAVFYPLFLLLLFALLYLLFKWAKKRPRVR